jgi:hypothetical protein
MSTTLAPTAITIRRATSADLPRLGRLGALLVEEHHAFDDGGFFRRVIAHPPIMRRSSSGSSRIRT